MKKTVVRNKHSSSCTPKLRCLFAIICLGGALLISSCQSSIYQHSKSTKPTSIPEDVHQGLEKAFSDLDNNRLLESKKRFHSLIKSHPGSQSSQAWYGLGVLYLKTKDSESARKSFLQFLNYSDSSLIEKRKDSHQQLAQLYFNVQNYEQSLRHLDALERSGDNSHQTLMMKIRAYLALSHPKKAFPLILKAYRMGEEVWNQSLLNYPQYYISHQSIEKWLLKMSRNQLPDEELESVLKYADTNFPFDYITFRRAEHAFKQQDRSKAQKLFESFLNLHPDHEWASKAKRRILYLEGSKEAQLQNIGLMLPLNQRGTQIFSESVLESLLLNLNGQQNWVVYPSGVSDEETLTSFESLLKNHQAMAVVGPLFPRASATLAGPAQSLALPLITFSNRDDIALQGEYVFQHSLMSHEQAYALANFAKEHDYHKLGILYPNNSYGIGMMKAFWEKSRSLQLDITGIEMFSPEDQDFKLETRNLLGLEKLSAREREVAKIWQKNLISTQAEDFKEEPSDILKEEVDLILDKESELSLADIDTLEINFNMIDLRHFGLAPKTDFDALFIPFDYRAIGQIAPTLAYYGLKDVPLLGTNEWHHPELLRRARSYLKNAILLSGFHPFGSSINAKKFESTFKNTYGKSAGLLPALAQDIFQLFSQIPDTVLSRSDLKNHLLQIHFSKAGAGGFLAFNQKGQSVKELTLLKVNHNTFLEEARIRPLSQTINNQEISPINIE